MIETLLTLLCFIIPIIYVKIQDGSLNLDNFKQDKHPKRKYKPKQYISDIEIPNTYQNQDFSRDTYVEHLMSEKWKQTKLTRLLIDDFKCKQCNKPITAETSHCHHITYQNLGDEGMKDVVSVCSDRYENNIKIEGCHSRLHRVAKEKGISKYYPLSILE